MAKRGLKGKSMQNRDRNIRRGKFARQGGYPVHNYKTADSRVVALGLVAVLAVLTLVTKLALGL